MEQQKHTIQSLKSQTVPEGRSRDPDQISLIDGAAWLLARWRWITLPALLGAALFLAATFLEPAVYTATGTFMPEESGGESPSRAGSGDGLLGLLLDQVGRGSGYYVEVIKSRSVLGEVAAAEYSVRNDEGEVRTATLRELWGYTTEEPERAQQRVVASLSDMIDVQSTATGLVRVQVESPEPELAEQIAGEVLRVVDDWNRERRQTSAVIERDFIAERVEEAQQELLAAENALMKWLEENRLFDSPQKEFELQRLQRRVDLKQQVYVTLAQTHEQVRLSAVRNTPAIAVLDGPQTALEPEDRPLLVRAIMGLVLGGGLGLFLALGLGRYRDGQLGAAWRLLRNPAQ